MTGFHSVKYTFIFLPMLIVLSFAFAVDITAEEKPVTLSGRVVTAEGETVVDATVMFQISTVQTDSEGRFAFTKITPSQSRLRIPRNPMMKKGSYQSNHTKVRSIKFGSMTFYPHDFHDTSRSATFAIEPGTDIKDIEVTMERQLIVRGRIVFKNGEPLANTSFKINIDPLRMDGIGGFSFNRPLQTDAEGNFVHGTNTPGIYMLSLNHRGLSAASKPFIVEVGEPHERVVLTLDGNATDLSESQPEEPQKRRLYHPSTNTAYVPGVWIINPTNGHAYKWIDCEDREDAQAQAALEEAHLVTITNEPEQIWLEAVFGTGPYWIGLTDVAKEGEWEWDTGEPFAYTNWKADDEDDWFVSEPPAFMKFLGFKGEDRRREEEGRDYVIMSDWRWGGETGKWQTADHSKAARRAILEKGGH